MKNLTLLIKPAAGLCNINCTYCFYKSASRARDNNTMSRETVDMLIRKIREYGASAVNILFQGGEPTLAGLDFFRCFTDRVRQNLSVPVSYGLQSNGILIDNAWAEFFRENHFLLGVSLDGGRRTTDRYRLDKNSRSVLPQILNGISALRKSGVDFNILSVIDDKNAMDIENTWQYFKKHDFRFLQFIPLVDEGMGISLSADIYAFFLNRSFDLWYKDWEKGCYISVRHIDNYIRILMGEQPENCAMCGVCGSYFVLEANGDLFPCDFYCTEERRIGNIYDDDPFAQNEKQRSFISLSMIIHEHCRTCQWYALCRGGCLRDRSQNFTKNRYCDAYKTFFDHAAGRMSQIAKQLVSAETFQH